MGFMISDFFEFELSCEVAGITASKPGFIGNFLRATR